MASKYSSSGLTPSIPANLNYETITNEFSRLSDVQEEFYFMNGQLDGEPDDFYRIRNNISRNINESINNVKRTMLKLREDIRRQLKRI